MAETIGILLRFNKDTVEDLQLIKQNYSYIKKCVRKMVKKFNVFVPTDVTRTITLSHVNGDRRYRLRITQNCDLFYTTNDSSFKDDWNEMRFITVYVESLDPEIEKQSLEVNFSGTYGNNKTAEKLDNISSRLDKLEALFRAPVDRTDSGTSKPQQSDADPAPEKVGAQSHFTTPEKPTAAHLTIPARTSANNQKQIFSAPMKVVHKVGSAVPQAKTSSQKSANVKMPQSTLVKQLTVTAPPITSGSKVKKIMNDTTARKFPIPYNVSQPNNPKFANSTPQNVTNSPSLLGSPVKPVLRIPKPYPKLFDSNNESGGIPGTSEILKRPLKVSETNGAPSAKRKPPGKLTEPEALVHLEEVIDAVAVGLEDPNDFTIEPPFTQTLFDTSTTDRVSSVMEFERFVETLPKKKKSKKHKQSYPNMITLVE